MIIGGQYKILTELGVGGMGIVYQGVDQMLEREVAIKKLRSEFSRSPEVAERFRREAKIQARLNHPNLAHLYSFFKEDDVFYIVMEFVDGTPLGKLLPVTWQEALPVFLQVLEGLEFAHSLDVLHRDIKPDNIMVSPRGEVKVMDFGIAHVLGQVRQTREKTIVGTLEYVPPEQITGKQIGPAGDIYSLGIMLFEMMAGRTPFVQENEFALLRAHLETPTPLLSSVVPGTPVFMDEAIARATAKAPEQRFASCRAFSDFLRKSVPEIMDRQAGAFLRRSRDAEVDRCLHRLEALLTGGELGLAALVHERAMADYPGHSRLAEVATRIRRQRDTAAGTAKEDAKSQFLRETVTKLKEFEAQGQLMEADIYIRKALDRYPQVPALRIAAAYLELKQRPPAAD